MPNWVGWAGVIGTFVFGGLSVFQFIRDLISRRVRESEEGHVEALGNSLAELRLICNDTIQRGEILKSDASKQFVRQIAAGLRSAEAHVQVIQNSFKVKRVKQ